MKNEPHPLGNRHTRRCHLAGYDVSFTTSRIPRAERRARAVVRNEYWTQLAELLKSGWRP